jgi:rhodanese-related sulfurtransferase
MNKFILVTIIVLGLSGLLIMAKQGKKDDMTSSNGTALSMQTVKSDVSKGGRLIDVRTNSEYVGGHIDGAVNLSLQDIQGGIMPKVSKDKPVYIYCRSGSRSGQAAVALKAAGYRNVIDLGAMEYVQSIGGVIKS